MIPSIQALRAFDAAARHLSVQHAAEILNVTPGAISRQIQALEGQLGTPLFLRRHKGIELTRAGRAYLADIRGPLDGLQAATARARGGATAALTIWTNPTFAIRWFIPRWNRLNVDHPEIDIRLATSLAPVDFGRDDVDLAIQPADPRRLPAGLAAHRLVDVELTPVCAPAVGRQLRTLADLARVTLLHDDPRPDDWPRWLSFADVEGIDTGKGLHFDSMNLSLQAAIDGLGVAIAVLALVEDDLASGRLVRPFAEVRRSTRPFHVLYPKARQRQARLLACRDWLLAQAPGR